MVDDAEVLKENLTTEQIGELFVAVMDYLQTGTVVEVSQAVKYPYADYRKKVDRACTSYDEIVAKRAESGRKGGTAKAAKAKESQSTPKFKPPTLSQFKNAVKALSDSEEIDSDYFDIHDVESFYDELGEDNWHIGSMPILTRRDWEKAIVAKFCYGNTKEAPGKYYELFEMAYGKGVQNEEGKTAALEMVYDFSEEVGMYLSSQILKKQFEKYLSENRPP